ncbi:hypothetical protein FAUST_1975 [Fusarium austroamericanum]|uniref:Uncharacterized protein n=1 Tax=Fusarium austroamericanum TaxID=282268 RepID=A0AAN6C7I4_FUSAU|nr:hypothetical protein FAUST_1975 [Fusarium austroamericanum]
MDKTWADAATTSSSLPPRLVNAVTVTTPTAEATTDDAVPHAPFETLGAPPGQISGPFGCRVRVLSSLFSLG